MTYVIPGPTSDDVGHRLTATLRVDGGLYARQTYRSAPTAVVTTSGTTVTVSAKSAGKGKVVLTMRAVGKAARASALDTTVVVHRTRGGSDRLRSVTMRDGRASTTLTGQAKGRRTYYVDTVAVKNRLKADRSPKVTTKVR